MFYFIFVFLTWVVDNPIPMGISNGDSNGGFQWVYFIIFFIILLYFLFFPYKLLLPEALISVATMESGITSGEKCWIYGMVYYE